MAKIDNSTKGWGNVLKPQIQADPMEVIQPREMKLDELVAVLDKMSDKGSKVVKCKDPVYCSEMTEDLFSGVWIEEFKFSNACDSYFGHIGDTELWIDTRALGNSTITSAVKQMWKQQLADEIGISTEYKLPEPLNVRINGNAQAFIESVKITNDYNQLNFTYKGKTKYDDGETYDEEFDPDLETEFLIKPSVIADVSKNVLDTIAKEKNVGIGKGQEPAQAVDVEQTLHDNFEELMKEQEKQDYHKGLKF